MYELLEYVTDNIIVGYGEVPSVQTEQGIAWVLPGGAITHNKEEATIHAEKLDRLVRLNLNRYNRKLFK